MTAPIANSYLVTPSLVAGPMPSPQEIEQLKEYGVTAFINLVELDVEGSDYDPNGPTVVRAPITDFGVPSTEEMVAALDYSDHGLASGRVYLHCRAGIGRTGTAVGCWMIRHGLAESSTVIEAIAAKREAVSSLGPSPETPEQRRFIEAWAPGQ